MQIAEYEDSHFGGVDRLWQSVFPGADERNRAHQAIPMKTALEDGLFWVALDDNGDVIGTVMAGWDGHRGWLYFVATSPDHRRRGVGGALVRKAVAELGARGCGKVNLQIRAGNEQVQAFYQSLGFETEPRTSMGMLL